MVTEKLTIVFDRGVNSTENFDEVLGVMHVIGALDRPQAKALFEVPLEKFEEVAKEGRRNPSSDTPPIGRGSTVTGGRW